MPDHARRPRTAAPAKHTPRVPDYQPASRNSAWSRYNFGAQRRQIMPSADRFSRLSIAKTSGYHAGSLEGVGWRAFRQRGAERLPRSLQFDGHAPPMRLGVVSAGLLLLLLAAMPSAPASAGILDPLNPFSNSNTGPVTPEEKARRDQARTELYDRLSPGYAMSVPFVSEAAVASLQQGIERYQQIVAAGGWSAMPGNTSLRPGDTGAEVAAARRQLALTGDLPSGGRASPVFDAEFQDGLARFQIRNGLRVSGFLNSRTYAALNVSAQERLKQLETNLARVKSMLKINKAPRYVLVNVPAFTLQAVDRGELALTSNVVVGKPTRATPAVSAQVVEVNFYPTWTVPESIARADLIPKLQKDPGYFTEEHFSVVANGGTVNPLGIDWNRPEVVNYRFVQDPGTFNALGVVRINMPNKHSVYMHDTPLKQLFSQSARAFSSGCVRVQRVLDLVAWLLGPLGWTPEKVQAAAENGKSLTVALGKSVPVHFVYLTAFVSENGMVQFGRIFMAVTRQVPTTPRARAPWSPRSAAPSRPEPPKGARGGILSSPAPQADNSAQAPKGRARHRNATTRRRVAA